MAKGPRTIEDDREQTRHLFAIATAMLEDAIEVAVVGQSTKTTLTKLAAHARRLEHLARQITVLAQSIQIIAASRRMPPKHRRQSRRRKRWTS